MIYHRSKSFRNYVYGNCQIIIAPMPIYTAVYSALKPNKTKKAPQYYTYMCYLEAKY